MTSIAWADEAHTIVRIVDQFGETFTVPADWTGEFRKGNGVADILALLAQAEPDPYVAPPPPDLDAIDTATLNAKLLEPGSIDRAELKTLFNHENRIRVLEAKAPITQAQFVAAIKVTMRNGG